MTADSPSSFPTSLIDLRGVKGKNCQDGTPCRGGNMGCARIEGNGAVGPSHKRHQSGKGRFSQGIDDAFGMLHPVFDGVHLRTMRFNARYDDGRIIARDEPVSKGGEFSARQSFAFAVVSTQKAPLVPWQNIQQAGHQRRQDPLRLMGQGQEE